MSQLNLSCKAHFSRPFRLTWCPFQHAKNSHGRNNGSACAVHWSLLMSGGRLSFLFLVRLWGADPDSLSVSNCRRLVVTLVNLQPTHTHTTATTDHNAFCSSSVFSAQQAKHTLSPTGHFEGATSVLPQAKQLPWLQHFGSPFQWYHFHWYHSLSFFHCCVCPAELNG